MEKKIVHVAALTMLGAFRLIADNPLPMELLPVVRFECFVVSSKVLKMGGRFYNRTKHLCGIINAIDFKVSE
jgi:hypothetical protein